MTEDNDQVTAAPAVGQLAGQGQDAGERAAGLPARQNAATAITENHPPDPVPGAPAGRQGQAPAWQGPLAGAQLQQQDPTPPMPGMTPTESPGSGDPAGPGDVVPLAGPSAAGSARGRPSSPGRRSVVARIAAGAVAVTVAGAVAWGAVAAGEGHVNVLLILAVAGVAVAELVARGKGIRVREGRAADRPPALINLPAWSGARVAGIAGLLSILVFGAVMGILSWFSIMASDGCPTGGDHCGTVIGIGWLVLIASQALIFFTALPGAACARSPGQLARAVILGLGGPVLAFAAFGAAINGAIPG